MLKLTLTLALSFLLGLEREQHKTQSGHYTFGGVRTFPLIGLVGYGVAVLSHGQALPLALGLVVVGAFLLVSYFHKLATSATAGMTTEVSGLATYLVGALVCNDHLWVASSIVVLGVLLLELKTALERLTTRISADEVFVFAKFLLLTAVVLPIVPDRDFGRFTLNPFRTWLAVVAVSAVSYGGYVLQKIAKGRGGIFVPAILGGIYSSTVTTVVLAKRSRGLSRSHLFAGAILTASGMMYARLVVLLAIFNRSLFDELAAPLLALAAVGVAGGWAWSRLPHAPAPTGIGADPKRNPLELRSALLFAAVFVAMSVATHLAAAQLGRRGLLTLATILGLADVDPFILGIAQKTVVTTGLQLAAQSIVVAAASNGIAKGVYAITLAEPKVGREALLLLCLLSLAGLSPLFWV